MQTRKVRKGVVVDMGCYPAILHLYLSISSFVRNVNIFMLRRFGVEDWYKMQIYFYVAS